MPKAVEMTITDQGVAVVNMNGQVPLNVFRDALCYPMLEYARELARNDQVKVVLIKAEGPCFSAGGDLDLLSGLDLVEHAKLCFDISNELIKSYYELKVPVISAVHGAVAGAGLSLMMASDIVLAAEETRLVFAFVHVGFSADSGCSYFLPRKVGYSKAAEILMLGQILTARQGLEMGLVNRVLPPAELHEAAHKMASRLASGPARTIAMNKALLRASADNDFNRQIDLESHYQVINWMSDDFREGVEAFRDKRRPHFPGTENTINRRLDIIARSLDDREQAEQQSGIAAGSR